MSGILKRFYTVIGNVTIDQVKQQNKNGSAWASAIDKVAKEEEAAVSSLALVPIILPRELMFHHQDPRITKIKIR